MPVLTCPACEGPLKVAEGASGLIHCPRCKELVGIPEPPRSRRPRSADSPSAAFWEGATHTQVIAAAVAGGLALCVFFFCCCGGFVLPNWLWGWH